MAAWLVCLEEAKYFVRRLQVMLRDAKKIVRAIKNKALRVLPADPIYPNYASHLRFKVPLVELSRSDHEAAPEQ